MGTGFSADCASAQPRGMHMRHFLKAIVSIWRLRNSPTRCSVFVLYIRKKKVLKLFEPKKEVLELFGQSEIWGYKRNTWTVRTRTI